MQIRDENNNLIASYVYDAWGKVLSVNENTTNNIGSLCDEINRRTGEQEK